MIRTTIPEYRRGFAKAEYVTAYQNAKGALFAVHRVANSTRWTIALAHTPGPADSLAPQIFPRRRDTLLELVAYVEEKCPDSVETWRGIDAVMSMRDGLSPAQAEAGRRMRQAAHQYAAYLAERQP